MNTQNSNKADYGNWVSKKFIYVPGMIGIVFLGLAFLSIWWLLPAVLFLMVSAYFIYTRYLFSPQGGDIQKQIRDLVLANLDWDGNGQALDIGCGNGALSIELARKYPQAQVVGIDYWGKNWEYSQGVCENNATVEGVGGRATFQKASASALPFGDETFDVAVSNLVFHEVGDTADKRELVREALRVVKKGGRFAFQDLFLLKQVYGEPQELLKTFRS
jgi:ubiquinone/menaquinone biosynthesis C-methylase UbiE